MSELRPQTSNLAHGVERNRNKLREIERTIVSVYILSADDFMLLGRQDPSRGGTYPTAWRAPGGGVKDKDEDEDEDKPRETLVEAMVREAGEEVVGLNLTPESLKLLPIAAVLAAEKTLDTGERVWQRMDLRHFETRLDQPAAKLSFVAGDDLVELRWFGRQERAAIELIPGGRELMLEGGYIDPPSLA